MAQVYWGRVCSSLVTKPYNEAYGLYEKACDRFWTTTHFSFNVKGSTPAQIERALGYKHATKITKLTIYGRGPELKFTNGIWIWICIRCDGLQDVPQVRCPHNALMLEGSPDSTGGSVPKHLWHQAHSFRDLAHNDDRWVRFITLDIGLSKEDIEIAKEAAGWNCLTKKELVGMVEWYMHYQGSVR